MRSQRERGASPETIAVAPAAWRGRLRDTVEDVVDVGSAGVVPEVFEAVGRAGVQLASAQAAAPGFPAKPAEAAHPQLAVDGQAGCCVP